MFLVAVVRIGRQLHLLAEKFPPMLISAEGPLQYFGRQLDRVYNNSALNFAAYPFRSVGDAQGGTETFRTYKGSDSEVHFT